MRLAVQYPAMFKRLIKSHALRRRTSWLIAAILILPFILFFHASGRAPAKGPGGTAGVIFGREIPWETFQTHRVWTQRQWENRFGDVPETLAPLLTQSTWDRLILLEEAKRRHLRVDDAELAARIAQIPAFQQDGRFLPERYKLYLRAINISASAFEQLLREDLLVEQLVNSVKNSATVSDQEVREAYEKKHERLTALLFWFDPASFTEQAAAMATEANLRAFYEAHAEEFRIPEQLSLEYAGASREELAPLVTVTDADLEAFYQDHPDQFKQDDGAMKPLAEARETVRRHVIDERVRKQLTALALDLQEDLEEQRPFEEIVKTRALVPHAAGPLAAGAGWVPDGPDPGILQAVAKLAEGQISEVIRSDAGVYLARVTTRIPSRVPPFEEVREQARSRLIQEEARKAAQTAATSFHARLNEQLAKGLRLEEALILEMHTPAKTVSFTRTEPIESLGEAPRVNETAFGTPLGAMTEVLETSRGFVLLRPEARAPADPTGFAAEEAALRQETLTQRQSAHVEEWMTTLRARAKLQSFVD